MMRSGQGRPGEVAIRRSSAASQGGYGGGPRQRAKVPAAAFFHTHANARRTSHSPTTRPLQAEERALVPSAEASTPRSEPATGVSQEGYRDVSRKPRRVDDRHLGEFDATSSVVKGQWNWM